MLPFRWQEDFQTGDVAWLAVVSVAVLVLLWPGLVLFYTAIVPPKNLAETVRRCLLTGAVLSCVWGGWVFSLAFAPSWGTMPAQEAGGGMLSDLNTLMTIEDAKADETAKFGRGGVIGGPDLLAGRNLSPNAGDQGPIFPTRRPHYHLPLVLFAFLQLAVFLAIPAPLLVLLGERFRGTAVLVFAVLWGTVVYAPLAHWTWGEGWLWQLGAIDFGGGLLHVGVGFSALACALLALRDEGPRESALPSLGEQATLRVNLGAVLCWAGALLLHAGCAMKPDGRAAAALFNTQLAVAASLLAWIFTTHFLWKRTRPWGAAAGCIAGLVAIAPACGLTLPQSAPMIGLAAGVIGSVAFEALSPRMQRGGMLAVFVIQGIAGALGTVLVGVFVTSAMGGVYENRQVGGLVEGNAAQLGIQALAVAATAAWAFAATLLIWVLLRLTFRARLAPEIAGDEDAAARPAP